MLKQLLDVLSGDPTKDVASTLVTKTLSVIYHFDGILFSRFSALSSSRTPRDDHKGGPARSYRWSFGY